MEFWQKAVLIIAVIFFVTWVSWRAANYDGAYIATIFDDGDVATDGNRCRLEQHEGYRIIKCK